jgi:hypothetical protein
MSDGDEKDSGDRSATENSRRRRYQTPRLDRLGTLTEITAAVGTNGMTDMAGMGAKTS